MSDAIEFGLGGNNKGFVAVLNDTERRAKESSTRVTRELDKVGAGGLKGKGKIVADLDAIAGKFAEVKSASSAIEGILSKFGAGARMGGYVAVGALIAKGFADAAEKALVLEKTLETLRRNNTGGVGNVSMGELEANLATTRAERTKLIDPLKNQTKPGLLRAGADLWDGTKTALGDLATTGILNSDYTEKKHAEVRAEELRALDRIGEKQRELTELERIRIKGSTEQAEVLRLQAEYAEKIDAARDKGRGSIEAFTALTEERDFKIADVQRRASITRMEQGRVGNELFLRGRDSGKVSPVDAAAGNLRYAQDAAKLASTDEEKAVAEQSVKAAEISLKVAQKEDEERKAILATETRIADLRGSSAAVQQRALSEQVGLAEKLLSLATSATEKDARTLDLAKARKALDEFSLSRRVTEIRDNADIAGAKIGNLAAKAGIRGSAIDEQRLALNAGVQQAETSRIAAQSALELDPENQQLQKELALAREGVTSAKNQRARWERDIARSQEDQLKTADAQLAATRLQLQDRAVEADIATKRVATELAATRATREGNDVLAQRIRQQGELTLKQEKYNRLIDENTGKARSESDVRQDLRGDRRRRRNKIRSRNRIDNKQGLLDVDRDSSGRVIGGIDPDSGQRVSRTPGEGEALNALGSVSKGGTNFAEALAPRGAAAMLSKSSMVSTATAEMDQRKVAADSAGQLAKDMSGAAKAATPDNQALVSQVTRLVQILEGMSQGR